MSELKPHVEIQADNAEVSAKLQTLENKFGNIWKQAREWVVEATEEGAGRDQFLNWLADRESEAKSAFNTVCEVARSAMAGNAELAKGVYDNQQQILRRSESMRNLLQSLAADPTVRTDRALVSHIEQAAKTFENGDD